MATIPVPVVAARRGGLTESSARLAHAQSTLPSSWRGTATAETIRWVVSAQLTFFPSLLPPLHFSAERLTT